MQLDTNLGGFDSIVLAFWWVGPIFRFSSFLGGPSFLNNFWSTIWEHKLHNKSKECYSSKYFRIYADSAAQENN